MGLTHGPSLSELRVACKLSRRLIWKGFFLDELKGKFQVKSMQYNTCTRMFSLLSPHPLLPLIYICVCFYKFSFPIKVGVIEK